MRILRCGLPYFFGRRDGERVTIEGDDAAHLARSLRARAGEMIQVVEPEGRLLTVRIQQVSASRVSGAVVAEVEHRPEPERQVWLAVAMLPADRLELVLSRCTEAGAAGFWLVQGERSVARAGNPARWARICREASMLAGRLVIPEVVGPLSLPETVRRVTGPVLLDRSAGARLLPGALQGKATLFVGPEGGWTDAERAVIGGPAYSLGPRNLRADTAALVALAIALAEPA